MVPRKKKTRLKRAPEKVVQLAAQTHAARERTKMAKEQAKLAKRQAHEARKLFKEAKKVAKRAKVELHALSVKLKRLLGNAAVRVRGDKADRTGVSSPLNKRAARKRPVARKRRKAASTKRPV